MRITWPWKRKREVLKRDENGVREAKEKLDESEQSLRETQRDVIEPLRELRKHNRVSELAIYLLRHNS